MPHLSDTSAGHMFPEAIQLFFQNVNFIFANQQKESASLHRAIRTKFGDVAICMWRYKLRLKKSEVLLLKGIVGI